MLLSFAAEPGAASEEPTTGETADLLAEVQNGVRDIALSPTGDGPDGPVAAASPVLAAVKLEPGVAAAEFVPRAPAPASPSMGVGTADPPASILEAPSETDAPAEIDESADLDEGAENKLGGGDADGGEVAGGPVEGDLDLGKSPEGLTKEQDPAQAVPVRRKSARLSSVKGGARVKEEWDENSGANQLGGATGRRASGRRSAA